MKDSMHNKYSNLFSIGRIGNLYIRNRIIMSPTETLYASVSGEVTPQIIEFYKRRAKGGVGLIILHSIQGNSIIDTYDPYAGSLRIDNNAYIPMLSDLTEAVHNEGAKIAALVSIGGGAKGVGDKYIDRKMVLDSIHVAPSEIVSNEGLSISRSLTTEEIKMIIYEYGRCCWRAKVAGFDAFVIHALGSYLLAEFLSPLFNHREDKYGGSAENRWRILFELLDSCRKQSGDDFPIIIRLSVDEMHKDGRSFDETLHFLSLLEEAGVSALDVTAGLMDPLHRSLPSAYVENGANKKFIERVKASVSIPIINSGRLNNPDDAELWLKDNVLDFVSIGRGLIADPDWPNKVKSGNTELIRNCLCCNYCIGQRIMQNLPIRCAINPYVGHESTESEYLNYCQVQNHYVIIGAGPAGLEVARTLGLVGHIVDIYEASDQICGGQIKTAMIPPNKEMLSNLIKYYDATLRGMCNIRIHLETKLSLKEAEGLRANAYFVATGARPFIPSIHGIDNENVYTAERALRGEVDVGNNILIFGGGQVGAETAHYFAEKGKKVTIVDLLPEIAMQEEPISRNALLYLLKKDGVECLTRRKVLSVGMKSAKVMELTTKEETQLIFDTALLAFGTKSQDDYSKDLLAKGLKAYVVGDACKSGNIAKAIADAHTVALLELRLVNE